MIVFLLLITTLQMSRQFGGVVNISHYRPLREPSTRFSPHAFLGWRQVGGDDRDNEG
jgi:hypothetical protein